jgi:hypothetical protein
MENQKPEEPQPQGEKEVHELTPAEIKGMDPMVRSTMCTEAINEVMRDFNCAFNPIAHLSNHGVNIQVKVIPMAYPVMPEPIDPLHIQ